MSAPLGRLHQLPCFQKPVFFEKTGFSELGHWQMARSIARINPLSSKRPGAALCVLGDWIGEKGWHVLPQTVRILMRRVGQHDVWKSCSSSYSSSVVLASESEYDDEYEDDFGRRLRCSPAESSWAARLP